jgi:hypothetical protein
VRQKKYAVEWIFDAVISLRGNVVDDHQGAKVLEASRSVATK